MTVLTGRIEGLKQLEAKLADLSKTYSDPTIAIKTLRPVLKGAIAPLQEDIKSRTPVKTGALQNSVKTVIKKPSKRTLGPLDKDTILFGKVGYFGKGIYKKALGIEFGNRNIKASSPIRSSFNSQVGDIGARFRKLLIASIEKKAKQLRRKK